MKRWTVWMLGLLAALPLAAAPLRPTTPPPGVRMEVLTFASDPPGEVREAPGGGRVLTQGLLFTPQAGANRQGPAIVMLDDGPGAHPLEAGQATRFAGERLAALGYTVLSLYTGQERNYPLTRFADVAWSVRSALDLLEAQGHEDLVLAGQGYGAIVVAHYLATQPDLLLDNGGERRVKAAVLFNPLTELRQYPRAGLQGPAYDELIARAEASVASGRGQMPRTLEPGGGVEAARDPWLLAGPFIGPAESVLDYWGPQAAQRNAELLKRLPVPTLILAGGRTPTVSLDALRALKIPAPLDTVIYPEGDARFSGLEQRSVQDLAAWLARRGLGVRPRVTVQALDVRAADGRVLQGVLYTPEQGLRRGAPLLMLIGGRTADTIQSSTHWMGWRLAQKGYAVLTPGLRIAGGAGIQSSTLAESADDIGRWVTQAAALGHPAVVLTGHSNGGLWVSNYLSLTQDPRVRGVVYFAPTLDEAVWNRQREGEAAHADNVARAQAAVARGDGLRVTIGLLSAQSYLDFNGPGSRSAHTERVKEFKRPGLAIYGAKDPLMSDAFIAQFSASFAGPLQLRRYEGGSHGLRESKGRLAQDVADWMQQTWPAAPAGPARR